MPPFPTVALVEALLNSDHHSEPSCVCSGREESRGTLSQKPLSRLGLAGGGPKPAHWVCTTAGGTGAWKSPCGGNQSCKGFQSMDGSFTQMP